MYCLDSTISRSRCNCAELTYRPLYQATITEIIVSEAELHKIFTQYLHGFTTSNNITVKCIQVF